MNKPSLTLRKALDHALLLAVAEDRLDAISNLLRSGANPNTSVRCDCQALLTAARRGYTDVVALLVENCDDREAVGVDTMSVLTLAAAMGYRDIVVELLESGADPAVGDRNRETALMAAAYMGHGDVVDRLLHWEVDPDARDNGGWTALTWAAFGGCEDVVVRLLEAGADPTPTETDILEGRVAVAARVREAIERRQPAVGGCAA